MVIIKEVGDSLDIKIQRIDIIDKISDILAGNAKRDDVSEWAFNIFDDDSLRLKDPIIFKYLKLLGAVDLPSCGPDTSTKQGYHNETYAPKPVKPENAVDKWDEFLGPGPHSNNHPRTALPDPDRIVSADGKRSIL